MAKKKRTPIPLAPAIDHLRRHVPIAREGDDVEGVHQVRVATRRLDVWLRMAARHTYRDDLRWLRRSAGAVRDLDVVLEAELPASFATWLGKEHARARRDLIAHLDDERLGALAAGLEALPALAPSAADAGCRRLARTVLQMGRRAEKRPAELEPIHRLRRSLRRLRYGLEWIGAPFPGSPGMGTKPLKRLQGSLGLVGDLAVTLELLRRSPLAKRLAAFDRRTEERLAEAQDEATADWRRVRGGVEELL